MYFFRNLSRSKYIQNKNIRQLKIQVLSFCVPCICKCADIDLNILLLRLGTLWIFYVILPTHKHVRFRKTFFFHFSLVIDFVSALSPLPPLQTLLLQCIVVYSVPENHYRGMRRVAVRRRSPNECYRRAERMSFPPFFFFFFIDKNILSTSGKDEMVYRSCSNKKRF